MRQDAKLRPPDYWLLGTTLMLLGAGLWLVLDASYAKAADLRSMNYDPYYQLKRQSVSAALGLVGMLIASRVSFGTLRRWAKLMLAAAVVSLIVLLVYGHVAHGSKSWFRYGPVSVQPSELAKVALVIYLATALSSWRTFAKGRQKRWLIPALACAVVIGLVVAQRDLGTAGLLGAASLGAFYAAGAKKRWLILIVAVGILASIGAMMFIPHCQARWRAFRDPWTHRFDEGYQTVHSLVGIGTSGWTGAGPCRGRVKFYMPAASTDYIYATLVEEMGLIGGIALLVGFGLFTYRGLHIAHRSRSVYGTVLASTIVTLVGVQVVINIAVVTATIPATGLSLPFISYGGSGLVAMLVCTGLLLSVSRQVDVVVESHDLDESGIGRRWDRGSHLPRTERSTRAAKSRTKSRAAVHR